MPFTSGSGSGGDVSTAIGMNQVIDLNDENEINDIFDYIRRQESQSAESTRSAAFLGQHQRQPVQGTSGLPKALTTAAASIAAETCSSGMMNVSVHQDFSGYGGAASCRPQRSAGQAGGNVERSHSRSNPSPAYRE